MKSETRNPKSEVQHHHAALTSSELATLLGPCIAQVFEPAAVVAETSGSRWTSFAEEFSRRLTARLRPLIRAAVRVTFNGSRPMTAEILSSSQETRDAVRLWQSAGSIEPIAAVMSVQLLATFVDRLLGGRSGASGEETDLHRPLTEVDQKLASRLSDAVLKSLNEQSEQASPLELTELPSDSHSLFDAWLPECSLLRLSFELRFVQGGGVLDLLLPTEIAESLADPSHVDETLNSPREQEAATVAKVPSRRSEVTAQLSRTLLSQSDLRSLAVGDVLLMPTMVDQTVHVLVDGRPEFEGLAGTMDGHKAIRLLKSGSVKAS